MDDVRALFILLPDAPLPNPDRVAEASAIVLVPPPDASALAPQRVEAALALGPPIYLALPPLDQGSVQEHLQQLLLPGVYGVAARPPTSIEQLRYLEGVLEHVEIRVGIRPGLTAMAVGFEHPRALRIMAEALQTMRDSADRVTWIAFNHQELAQQLGVDPTSTTVSTALSQAVLTASAYDLPVIYGDPETVGSAHQLGCRGCATTDASELARLRAVFDRPEADPSEDGEEP